MGNSILKLECNVTFNYLLPWQRGENTVPSTVCHLDKMSVTFTALFLLSNVYGLIFEISTLKLSIRYNTFIMMYTCQEI